jgi:adenylate cyclase
MDEEPSLRRRLAAILAAAIAGYSRLMHADEAATVRDLKAHQSAILPLIGRHGGRIIDTAGDGVMAEFPSVIGATECAIELQTVMAERNAEVPERRRMQFRIGINLGDVIHDETRIYGDGINIAAPLEALAEPGGVLVSNTVYDQVRSKLPVAFEDMGEQQVKNIEQPVRLYRLLAPGTAPESWSRPPAFGRRSHLGLSDQSGILRFGSCTLFRTCAVHGRCCTWRTRERLRRATRDGRSGRMMAREGRER